MFILTAKLNKKKAVATVLITGLLLCLLINCVAASKSSAAYMGQQTEQSASPALKTLKNESKRIKYLNSLGWEVESSQPETQDVIIPEQFDDTYTKYNAMQTENGFDLSKFKGKQATVYTYIITNHPTGESGVRANLIICKGKLIGGDICSKRLDGFMHGLGSRENA